ncbi:MAG: hypothetical protein P8Y44_10955, partial [Acidobacteriota bacterium]
MAEHATFGLWRAVVSGFSTVGRRRPLVLLAWFLPALFALVGAIAVESELRAFFGASGLVDQLNGPIDLGALEELAGGADGVAVTLRPVRLSPAAVFENLEALVFASWTELPRGLLALGALYLLAWVFVQGGVVADLIARPNEFRLRVLLGDCSRYFPRMLRLAALSALGYYAVYRFGRRLFPWVEGATKDVTSERLTLFLYLVAALCIVGLLACVHLVSDFARIALVGQGRRSSLLSVVSALFQLLGHPLQVYGVAAVFALLLFGLQVLYFW